AAVFRCLRCFRDLPDLHSFPTRRSSDLIFNMFFSLAAENGKNGSAKVDKAAAICNATYICVFTRSSSVLISFQGSSSARYLFPRSEEHTSELQSRENLVCRLLLEKTLRD